MAGCKYSMPHKHTALPNIVRPIRCCQYNLYINLNHAKVLFCLCCYNIESLIEDGLNQSGRRSCPHHVLCKTIVFLWHVLFVAFLAVFFFLFIYLFFFYLIAAAELRRGCRLGCCSESRNLIPERPQPWI